MHKGGWSDLVIRLATAKAAISCTMTSTVTDPAKLTEEDFKYDYHFIFLIS